ncbi:peptidoglycan editing factor PgeF [Limnohabitans sp. DM1]|uniref:peptidoglycan editing factor PgeF n=1 Tax=Limnohabitans sp. DM1 TaxID=1597955 RepID=UPI00351024AE
MRAYFSAYAFHTPGLAEFSGHSMVRTHFDSHIPPSWLRPQWPAPPNVKAIMTDRHGGVSAAPWDSMNLGDHVADSLDDVAQNRALLTQAIGLEPVFLKQVHGVDVVWLDGENPQGQQADACITDRTDVACTIMVADCLPVLMCDAAGQWVAGAHAGWRSLAGESGDGILERVLQSVRPRRPADILAWLGPCIGPQAFEVGAEVMAAFCKNDDSAQACFRAHGQGKFLADLAGLAKRRLQRMGITQIFGNNSLPDWCTVSQASRFFSHRRDSRLLGQTGRMAACIWLDR